VEDTVIILATEDDIHAKCVAREVESTCGGRAIILDTAHYPARWKLTHTINCDGDSFLIETATSRIQSREVAGVWWRRPKAAEIPEEVTDSRYSKFCTMESKSAFEGWIYALGSRVINPLRAQRAADQKPLQLVMAARAGLTLPDTVISNCPDQVRKFESANSSRTIYKILTTTSWQVTETRELKEAQLGQLDGLRFAPAIFQERIEPGPDIRVTIVDHEAFAVSIHPNHSGAQLDWRLDASATVIKHELPVSVVDKLMRFQGSLGLRFGAIDLRRNQFGDYVFLEVNTAGQYLFAEIHAGLPISTALAKSLLNPPLSDRAQQTDCELVSR
jgi:hypothetical protein